MNRAIGLILGLMITANAYATPNPTNGKTLYATYCQSCHGVGAVGVSGVGPLLKGEVAGWKPAAFNRSVLIGVDDEGKPLKASMPRWGKTGFAGKKPTNVQLQDIQAYLKSLK